MASLRAMDANFAYITTVFALLLKQIGGFSKLQRSKINLFNSGTKTAIDFNKKHLYENFSHTKGS